jgi:hypothetical protein
MTDKKNEPMSWNDLVEGDEQRLGVSKDVLRKLMQMNPNLRGGKSTEDLMRQVKSQMKEGPKAADARGESAKSAITTPSSDKGDVLDAVMRTKSEYDTQMKRFDAELKRIQDERTVFLQQALTKLIDQCLAVDPGLTSPKSQYVLQQEKPFLDKLGFSMQKLVERQKKTR